MTVAEVFSELLGKPTWNVTKGFAGNLTLEFGAPKLDIRAPKPDANNVQLRRRLIKVRGEWHLWIIGPWFVEGGVENYHSEQNDAFIDVAARIIDSKILQSALVMSDGSTVFSFEENIVLRVRNCVDVASEQWLLFRPDGFVDGLNSNGIVTREAAE